MAQNNTNARSKIDELRNRVHKHDVHIEIGGSEKSILTSKEWNELITSVEARLMPEKLNNAVATATSAYWLGRNGDKLTEQYDTDNEAHFGFTTKALSVITVIKDIFDKIDETTFFCATNGDSQKFNFSGLIKSLIGNEVDCLVSVSDMESLNWLFKRLQFFCIDLLSDKGYKSAPEFYSVELLGGDFEIKKWIVPAAYVAAVFNTTENIIIEDDGIKISFNKTAPTVGEIFCESDDYCLTSVHDAIKSIMTDYFYNRIN